MSFRETVEPPKAGLAIWAKLATPFAVLVVLHGVLSVVLSQVAGYRFDPGMATLLGTVLVYLIPWFLLVLLIRRVVLMAIVDRSEAPLADMAGVLMALFAERDRLFTGTYNLLLVAFFIGSFGFQKELVAVFQTFGWDAAFAELDRILHFGRDPYVWLLPLTGSPLVTTVLNGAYHAWFFLIYFVTFVACFAPRGHVASRAYLIAFVLTFAIGGNVMAMVFSSAGPVYFERLGLGGDFVPLMELLYRNAEVSPVWALDVQEGLWDAYVNDGVLAGISAMPSMHVATSVLMACFAGSYARWAGWVMWIFAAMIMVGSVHLGWHYAADGYAGGLIAVICWLGAKRWVAPRAA